MSQSHPSDLIPGYVLGALSEEEKRTVEAWLAESEDARAELRSYESMMTAYAAVGPRRKAPAHLTDDFRQRLAAEAGSASPAPTQVRPVRRITPRRIIYAVAALIIAAIAVLGFYTNSE